MSQGFGDNGDGDVVAVGRGGPGVAGNVGGERPLDACSLPQCLQGAVVAVQGL